VVSAVVSGCAAAVRGDGAQVVAASPEAAKAPSPKAAPTPSPPAAISSDAPGMAEYLAALNVYDAAVEAREADKKASPETFDPQFKEALHAFQQALPKATDEKLKLECLYRVWRCHVWLRDEQGGAKAWEAFATELQGIEDAKAREELIRWQLVRRRTRGDWDGAVKLLEWVAATNEGKPLDRWAKDELAWTLFLPLQRYPDAMKLCEEIIEKWPDGAEARRAHYRLGMMWAYFSRYRLAHRDDPSYSQDEQLRAKPHFEVVAERWPDSLEARVARVKLYEISLMLSGQKRINVTFIPARNTQAKGEEQE